MCKEENGEAKNKYESKENVTIGVEDDRKMEVRVKEDKIKEREREGKEGNVKKGKGKKRRRNDGVGDREERWAVETRSDCGGKT